MRDLAAFLASPIPRTTRAARIVRGGASQIAAWGLVAVAASQAAFAQPVFDPAGYDEQQQQIVERIDALRSSEGGYSAGLVAPLTELALLYGETDEHLLAIAALERALQVVRANRGIHSLDQAPLLWQAVRHEEARGDLAAAWDREQQLLNLANRHSQDMRSAAIFREVADKRMAVFDRWRAGEYPQQMIIGGYCESFGQIFTCNRHLAARQVLGDAQAYYADAIEVILRNELYSSEELRELEMKLVRTSDLPRAWPELAQRGPQHSVWLAGSRHAVRTRGIEEEERDPISGLLRDTPISARLGRLTPSHAQGGLDTPDGRLVESAAVESYYAFGRHSLARLYDYEVAASAPPVDQVNAIILLADWDLLYSRNALALERYEKVYTWLQEADAPQSWIEELFSPTTPVMLPAFEPNPLASEDTEDSVGYIDVAFRITRYGVARRITVLDATTTADIANTAQRRLVQLIRSSRFRPRVTDNEFGASSVVVRYYLNALEDARGDADPDE